MLDYIGQTSGDGDERQSLDSGLLVVGRVDVDLRDALLRLGAVEVDAKGHTEDGPPEAGQEHEDLELAVEAILLDLRTVGLDTTLKATQVHHGKERQVTEHDQSNDDTVEAGANLVHAVSVENNSGKQNERPDVGEDHGRVGVLLTAIFLAGPKPPPRKAVVALLLSLLAVAVLVLVVVVVALALPLVPLAVLARGDVSSRRTRDGSCNGITYQP